MGLEYNKINPGEARDIFRQMRQAQKPGYGLGVNRPTGEFLGPVKLDEVDPEETNAMGGYDTHFAATGDRAGSTSELLKNDKRLVLEKRGVRDCFGEGPQLVLENSVLKWRYDQPVDGSVFPVQVIYPKDYPNKPPTITVGMNFPPGTPHLLEGNVLCWIYPWEETKKRNIWQPGTDTAAAGFAVAYQWLLAFMVWDAIGEWPVPDALDRREA